jgi:hypothetical protein
MEIIKNFKIKKIQMILVNIETEETPEGYIDYKENYITIPLTFEQLIEVLENKTIQSILNNYLDVIEIYLEYPKNISNELKEKINSNKVGEKVVKNIDVEYFENNKKNKETIKVKTYKDLVQSFLDDSNLIILMYSFNKENLIKCLENLQEILEKGGE